MTQYWRLDSPGQTVVLTATDDLPSCIYWGLCLPLSEDLAALTANQQRPISGATLDAPVPLSLCPEEARGFMGHPGLLLSRCDGTRLLPMFTLVQVNNGVSTDAAALPQLECIMQDSALGLKLIQTLRLDPDNEVLIADSRLELMTDTQTTHAPQQAGIRVDWLSAPVLPVPDSSTELLDFSGRWCGEFQPQHQHWQLGLYQRESREGRTSHSHPPLLFSHDRWSNNTQGEVYGWHLGWAGGHRMLAEELTDGRRQVQFGISQHSLLLSAQQRSVQTPPLYLTYSASGMNPALQAFHQHSRQHIIHFPATAKPRPVHYNCWEAIYFEHDPHTLQDIASHAAQLGAERFVLDDGWFVGRNDDHAALGDWTVDQAKYPKGLHALIAHVQAAGMGFGLWVEPEMVNPDSALYRAHPDWVLGPAHHPTGRQQLVLDLSQTAVTDYLFDCLDALLREHAIEYLKWDHNRVCLGATAAQTEAFYHLLHRLRAAHPAVEIESCASGGGRIDFGVLQHTQRVWLSDSNDALERWRIQHEAALFLAPEVTGSHVGPRHCHTSGRVLPMAFRAWVAASRHMGFEMDPRELDQEERSTLQSITAWYKANRDWLFRGALHRLDSDDAAILAEMTLSANQQQFVVFAAQMTTSARTSTRLLRLTGLQPGQLYRLQLRNPEQIAPNLTRSWASPLLSATGLQLSGQALMTRGISLPVAFPATMWVLEGALADAC